ncbi:unnamed protein product [Protopolystoma xenopodis]|uniref:Uncharacterized protein n=1 Tax=Protopolystoma xenopodis TaxID=117903 RepID=A0A448WCB6_9PLAT|nr:unnamed protein product [Protopolystoma xenopodis]
MCKFPRIPPASSVGSEGNVYDWFLGTVSIPTRSPPSRRQSCNCSTEGSKKSLAGVRSKGQSPSASGDLTPPSLDAKTACLTPPRTTPPTSHVPLGECPLTSCQPKPHVLTSSVNAD